MVLGDNEPVSIVFFGGIKVNQMETNAAFSVGESFYQSLESQVKNNLIAGQTFGDFVFNNFNPIASPVYDPDGMDSFMPIAQSSLGLED
ncbi:spore germination protein [Bacillus sp. AK128]